jgi:O-antigen/teichoic acid export membrane protein
MTRLGLSMLVSLVLPPFLIHHMPPAEFNAWVLILQLSNYVNLLDFGLQTAIGKFVSEYDASGDRQASHDLVSTTFTLLGGAALLACLVVAVMVWFVPEIFPQLPPELVPQVRLALLAVGLTSAAGLPFNTFASTFTGLQQYLFPTVLATVVRVGTAIALITFLLMGGRLVGLGILMGVINLVNSAAQLFGWYRYARARVSFSFFFFHRQTAIQLARYGGAISVWSLAMLFVSGLDLIIVGHYQYSEAGYYQIATGAATFMMTIVSSIFGPLVPAMSSMQANTSPTRLGDLCIRITRYCVLVLCLLGMPLVVGAYPLLCLWVRKAYAASQATPFLQVMVLGNMVRYLALPYSLVVVATGKQHLATVAAVAEACVNLALSIYLVQRVGAVGVALGTLIGAFVSVGMHLLVSIPRTQNTFLVERPRFLMQGLARPLLTCLPSILLFPFWKKLTTLPASPAALAMWALGTMAIAWFVALTNEDRLEVRAAVTRLLY